MLLDNWEIALRLILAVFLGGMIGYERERHNRPAGLRTHILVCTGSCLMMMVSAYGFGEQLGGSFVADPGRIAAGVVTGIGFIGAGTIIQQRGGVRGLTTAASIWVVSGVGLAVGIGFYLGGALTTVFVLISLLLLRQAEWHLLKRQRLKTLMVRAVDRPGLLGRIGATLGDMHVNIRKSELGDPEQPEAGDEEMISIEFLVEPPPHCNLDRLFKRLYTLNGVTELRWEGELIEKEGRPEDVL